VRADRRLIGHRPGLAPVLADRHARDPADGPASGAGKSRTGRVRGTFGPALVTRKPAIGCLLEIAETLVLTLIIFWVIQSFVAQPFKVQQNSMEQTLEPDQYVLADKLTPRFGPYKLGDIVVFNPPESWVEINGEPYIKRVIGVGGDTVTIRDGSVFL